MSETKTPKLSKVQRAQRREETLRLGGVTYIDDGIDEQNADWYYTLYGVKVPAEKVNKSSLRVWTKPTIQEDRQLIRRICERHGWSVDGENKVNTKNKKATENENALRRRPT